MDIDASTWLQVLQHKVDDHAADLTLQGARLDRMGGQIDAILAKIAEAPKKEAKSWLSVTDPEKAREWLTSLYGWTKVVLPFITTAAADVKPCWPWHPAAVVQLMDLQAFYETAFTIDAPQHRLRFHDQHVPECMRRMAVEFSAWGCSDEGHSAERGSYDQQLIAFDHAYLEDIARWWATTIDRTAPAPGLRRKA